MPTQSGSGTSTGVGPQLPAVQAKQRFEVLHHPWRARILEVLNERDMSVSQFVDEGLIDDLVGRPRDKAISALAYHFRALREARVIEVVEQHARRGSTELVCRGSVRVLFTDDEWADLPSHERLAISHAFLNSFMARAQSAVHQGTFDRRVDRHLSWLAMEVDEAGWSEVVKVMNDALDAVMRIQLDAKQRIDVSGEKPIRTTWGQLHFESPPLPAPRAGD